MDTVSCLPDMQEILVRAQIDQGMSLACILMAVLIFLLGHSRSRNVILVRRVLSRDVPR
jgi:hypothetical protein